MGSTAVSGTDPLAAGRAALRNGAWDEARARFEEAASAGDAPQVWEGLSRAAWWQGDQEATLAARERAYRAYREVGDVGGAAWMAMWVASDHLDFRGDDVVASAWLRRGRALLRDREPCPELGYITLLDADIALLAKSDPATAERLAREALELARRTEDVGVEVVALALLGSALVASGAVEEGLRRLDECAALAVGEEFVETAAPGWALCHTVSACADVGDFRRAEQWCRALHTWSAVWQARHFFGVCRTAYGEVLATGGDWRSAEQELLSAMDDLRTTRPALAAPTAVRLGRLRVRQGDLAEARALFEAALPLPQAILALGELDLAGGAAAAAIDAADRVLRRLGNGSVLDRFPALELLARARAATGDVDAASATTAELERETAEARMLLSSVLEALGRLERAEAEARAAREAFALLGARAERRGGVSEELSPREVDILRLVAQGLGDAQIAERLFLSPHTVHRHIANVRTKLRVPSRAAAVAHATRQGLF